MNISLIFLGKIISFVARLTGSAGATWPGHIALNLNPKFIHQVLLNSKTKIIVVAGTNGKTTTTKLIRTILEEDEKKVFQNTTGANLLNGIASALIDHSSIFGKLNYEYAVFEIDENTLPLVLKELTPDYLVLLNLFRDQLDRYGEVNIVASKWHDAIKKLPEKTQIIANADDPQIAYIAGKNAQFFGLEGSKTKNSEHASDSIYCPKCSTKLEYKSRTFSHLGDWYCPNCKFSRPKVGSLELKSYPLAGNYNKYNTFAAVLLAKTLGIEQKAIDSVLNNFKPAFGRQEMIEYKGKKVQIFLSKNPTSFNESLRTMIELGGKNVRFVLNDRIPDGRDVSWIWDTDLENLSKFKQITVSGDRAYDMALRIKYSSNEFIIEEDLKKAIESALDKVQKNETLYILPTYSAMLEVREILTGKKIL